MTTSAFEHRKVESSHVSGCVFACLVAVFVAAGCATQSGETSADLDKSGSNSLEQFRLAVAANPEKTQLHYEYANALFDERLFMPALTEYQICVAQDPLHSRAYSNLGLCLKIIGNTTDAIEAYRTSLKLEPDHPVTLSSLSRTLAELGSYNDLIECTTKLIELKPDDIWVISTHANTLCKLERHEEAISFYERLLKLDPGNSDDYYNLGLCYYHTGEMQSALREWQTALAYNPKHPSVHRGMTVLYWKLKDYERAWSAVEKCQILGIPLDPEFIRKLQNDSGKVGPK